MAKDKGRRGAPNKWASEVQFLVEVQSLYARRLLPTVYNTGYWRRALE